MKTVLLSFLRWRGPGGAGWPLWVWGVLWLWVTLWAQGFAAVEPLARLVPPFLGLALLIPVLQQASTLTRGERWERGWWLIEPVVVMGLLGLLTWDVWGYVYRHGIYTDSYDHHIMIARADEFSTRLLAGQYPRYSHFAEGGDSLVDLYPAFLNLMVMFFRLFLPRGTPIEVAYTAMTIFAWWLRGIAVYHLTRRFAGPLIAMSLAIFSLFEVGNGVWDGIWSGTLFFGMVHNNLALTLGLYATAFQVDLARRFTRGRVAGTAVSMLVTCLSHPLGTLYVVGSTAGQLFALVWGRVQPRRALRTAFVLVAGLMLCAVVVMPFSYAIKNYGFFQPVEGINYEGLGLGLLDGKYPESSFSALLGFGMIAIVAGLLSRRQAVVGPSFVALIFWLLALTSFLSQTRFYVYVPSFLDGQQRRMLTVLKTALLPSAAWALSHLFVSLKKPGSLRVSRVFLRAGILALLLLGVGRALNVGFESIRETLVGQIADRPANAAIKRSNTSADIEKAIVWLTAARAQDPSATPWRLGLHYANSGVNHARFWGASYRMGVPVVDFVWMSAVFLSNRPREINEQGYKDWNIRYALRMGDGKVPIPDSQLIQRFSSGSVQILEYKGYNPDWVAAPPGTSIKDVQRQGDGLTFTVEGAPPAGADLLVRVGYLPRWRAVQDGQALPVGPAPPHGGALPRQDQLLLHAHNGRVEVNTNGIMPRTLPGAFLSLLGLAGLAFATRRRPFRQAEDLVWSHLDRLRERAATWALALQPENAEFSPRLLGVVAGVISVASLAAYLRGHRDLIVPPLEGEGMTASWSDGRSGRKCIPQVNLGRSLCRDESGKQKAVIDGWIGYDPTHDATGEFNRQWGGLRIVSTGAGHALLSYPRMRFTSRKLHMKVSTHGNWTLGGSVDGIPLPKPVIVHDHQEIVLDLPEGMPSVGTLVLDAEAAGAGSLVIAGTVE